METACIGRTANRPKERFVSERAARRAVARKRRFRSRDWPVTYKCPDCKGVHLTSGGDRW